MGTVLNPSMLPPRIAARIRIDAETGCWLWLGHLTGGYGACSWKGQIYKTHRLVYELLIAEISVGLVLDHLCVVRHCVNPAHLEPVTLAENARRNGHARRQDACGKGHPMQGRNLGVSRSGHRYCRECQKLWARQKRAADPEHERELQRERYRRAGRQSRKTYPGPGQEPLL
jgi:HNH endonuclease